MSNEDLSAINAAVENFNKVLGSERIFPITRKLWEVGDTSHVVVSVTTLIEMTNETFNDRPWKRVSGVGRSLSSFTERGCLLGKNGEDLTTDTVVGTLKNLVEKYAPKFRDGEIINLKVKSVKPILRNGQLTQHIVWQVV